MNICLRIVTDEISFMIQIILSKMLVISKGKIVSYITLMLSVY